MITTALSSITADEYDAHEIGYDLCALSEMAGDPGLSDALIWVYENTPCTFCRYKALSALRGYNAIGEEILQEMRFDVNEDIRMMCL